MSGNNRDLFISFYVFATTVFYMILWGRQPKFELPDAAVAPRGCYRDLFPSHSTKKASNDLKQMQIPYCVLEIIFLPASHMSKDYSLLSS